MVWKPHVTVAAVIERDNKFLMIEERCGGKEVFNQPAGHLDPNESLVEAAIRETIEESACSFTPEAITGIYLWTHPDNGKTFLRVCFTGSCDAHDPDRKLDTGILRSVWMSRDEISILPLRSPMVLKCIDDYLQGIRHPLSLLSNILPHG